MKAVRCAVASLAVSLAGCRATPAYYESLETIVQRQRDELPPAHARPCDPWVLRCVLDGNPRMLVIALGEDLWLAYDTTTCSLAKAWVGDVDFDGPVYTSAHGPQPVSRGETLPDPFAGSTWMVAPGERARVRFAGYTLNAGHVTLHWDLWKSMDAGLAPDGPPLARVQETPEVTRDEEGRLTLARLFEAAQPAEVEVFLQAPLIPLTGPPHLRMDCVGSGDWGMGFADRDGVTDYTLRLGQGAGLLWKGYEREAP
jgi:hypothetical protein